jgi:MFS family permease
MRRPSRPEDSEDPHPGTLGRDRVFGAIAAALFSVALGVASVAVPLLAVRSGHGLTQVGILIAISAVSQMAARLFMGSMMRRIPDKVFVVGSALLIAASCGLLTVSTSLFVFVISQLLQGAARAFFWTGSQTHAVRSSASAVGALTLINLASGAGALVGPALAGLLASRSLEFSLAVGAGIGVAAVIPSLLLVRFRPFLHVKHDDGAAPKQIWRRPGVNAACWMGVTAGSWRGLLNSYVPVILSQAGQTASAVGFLVAVANAAALLGSAASGWVRSIGARGSLLLGVITTGVGIAGIGTFADTAYLAACCLAVSGVGAGILQTVGPALATETVHPEERGQAIASTGTFRAAALFLAPMGMAGIVLVLPVGAALLIAGFLMTTPALAARSAGKAPG